MTTDTAGGGTATTRRFALSRSEWATTVLAGSVSATAYLAVGYPYLARGVVADLLGFAVLATAAAVAGARLKHEAVACLALIGLVVLLAPQWPLAVPEAVWWVLFLTGLTGYLALRRRICD